MTYNSWKVYKTVLRYDALPARAICVVTWSPTRTKHAARGTENLIITYRAI